MLLAKTAAAMAAAKPARLNATRAFFLPGLVSGSTIITSVATTERISSGRNRRYSTPAGRPLADTGELLRGYLTRRYSHLEWDVLGSLFEDRTGDSADAGQKCLRAYTQPHHHHEQRNHGAPFAHGQVG